MMIAALMDLIDGTIVNVAPAFTAAFELAAPLAIAAFAGCALLSLALPRTAVPDAYE
jgi:hypothetical protein